MSQSGLLGAVCFEVESGSLVGEDIDTTATLRFPVLDQVDVSGLIHERIAPNRVEQYLNAGSTWIQGTMEGTFKTRSYLFGHGSSTTGSVSETAYEAILADVIGDGAVVAASGTTLTGGTANVPTTTASGTYSAGGLAFVGARGDTDGEGQAYAIASHTTNSLTLLTDLAGAPQNGAVLSSGHMIYTLESPTTASPATYRFLLQTSSLQYLCHGCCATSWSIVGMGPNELPIIEITWQVAWWEYKAGTFPSAVSTVTSNPAKSAGGSLWVNDKGTSTNATRGTMRSFTYEVSGGMEILRGPGGVNQYQTIIGYRRVPAQHKISWVEDADAATTSPVVPEWTAAKHVLLSHSLSNGSRLAFYWPNVCPSDNKPVQFVDQNLNRLRFTGMAYTNTVTTSALTLSAFRMLSA